LSGTSECWQTPLDATHRRFAADRRIGMCISCAIHATTQHAAQSWRIFRNQPTRLVDANPICSIPMHSELWLATCHVSDRKFPRLPIRPFASMM
jgi:hypothetical protein